jgi:hypothetical protein
VSEAANDRLSTACKILNATLGRCAAEKEQGMQNSEKVEKQNEVRAYVITWNHNPQQRKVCALQVNQVERQCTS